jgi:hypothetical protein
MDKLIPLEYKGKRILLTVQLSESLGTDPQNLVNNFNRNKDRYTEGKHYIALKGEEKRLYLSENQIDFSNKDHTVLYLWPEKGAWMHAKSLNTDEAWQAYEALVDEYYAIKEPSKAIQPSSIEDLIILQAQSMKDMKAKVALLEEQVSDSTETVTTIKDTFLHQDKDWRKWVNGMLTASAIRQGGKFSEIRNESYRLLEQRAGCRIETRVKNIKDRLAAAGASKTKIDKVNGMDAIEDEKRLREIYTMIVKELSIGSL